MHFTGIGIPNSGTNESVYDLQIGSDVAAELGFNGKLQKISVNVLNEKTESFEIIPVEFQIESVNGGQRLK